ncbi:hypothetical protein [Kitasatospora aureofaciens]|uniref:hypothetical protein n=1 Tax=Kitasatospora aureofaciens TaxID=1894 RepID=UPI00131E7238|nr:hypothetical protein [Kitasatospora aureofaciens]HJD83315.1 hypothetical protein [Kitasatospora aureofaciens]
MTGRQHGTPSDGTAGGIGAALERRGFTTRALRARAAVVGVALAMVAAGVGAFLVGNLSNAFGPGSVCEGAVSADALHDALGPGAVGEQKYGDGSLHSGTAFCRATVSYGVFGNERSVTVELLKDTGLSVLADDAEARLFGASANGGAAGAAFDHRAWALLPEDCGNGLRVAVRSGGDDRSGARKLAGLAVSAANRVATQRACGRVPMPVPQELSEAGEDHDLDRNAVCGLPGLTFATAPGGAGLRETVTTATDPLWACRIRSTGDPASSAAFTIGTEPRLLTAGVPKDEPGLGRARWVEPGEMVATCHGKPAYFRVSWDGIQKLVPDSDETWKQFLTAGGRAIGCEPIV